MKKLILAMAVIAATGTAANASGWVAGIKYSKGYDVFAITDGTYGELSSHKNELNTLKIKGFADKIGFEAGYNWKYFGVSADHNATYRKDNNVSYTSSYLNVSAHTDMEKDTFVVGTLGVGIAASAEELTKPGNPIVSDIALKLELGIGKNIFENVVIMPFFSIQKLPFAKKELTNNTANNNEFVVASVWYDYTAVNVGAKLLVKF